MWRALTLVLVLAWPSFAGAQAPAARPVDVRFMCYSHANECEVTADLLKRFHEQQSEVRVHLDVVGFNVVREQLGIRLNAGAGPDIARVTNLGGLHEHYLDLSPWIDVSYWDENFGPTLDWLRFGASDRGIYGFLSEFTVSGPIVNKTMFDRAGVALPEPGATWDAWADAVREVQRRLSVYSGMVVDRSGHRFSGPAISFGARFFDGAGRPAPTDAGFRAWAERMARWHDDGLMPRDIWPGLSGARWRSGADMFINQDVVMHLTGSWSIQRYAEAIGNRFEWVAVPSPCGTVGCSGMPGGTAVVAFKHTRHPAAVARVMSFLVSPPILKEYYERTLQLPAHAGLARQGLDYGQNVPAAARAALKVFAADIATLSPVAHRLQGHVRNHVIFDAIVTHLSEAFARRLPLHDAYRRIEAEISARM